MNYQDAIEYLQTLPDAERDPPSSRGTFMPLESMKTLLEHLGNPQEATRTIHVTGSKGKGSTSTFIASILKSAGYRTALFTSPHFHSYRERIAFDLEPISEHSFAKGVDEIQAAIANDSTLAALNISTFGFLTALFFYSASKASPKIDWQIVEVGMGGTTDATNVFTSKNVAVITAISLEHTSVLGQSVSEIATNKAGIITEGCTTVLAPQRDPVVNEVISGICRERSSTLVDVDIVYKYEGGSTSNYVQQFAVTDADKHNIYQLHMLGKHQIENATTAIAAVAALQNPLNRSSKQIIKSQLATIKESAIKEGLTQVRLPGRFEIFEKSKTETIILDCAHNQDSARALVQTIKDNFPGRRCIFIIGVNQDKQIEAIYEELKEISKLFIATASINPRAMAPSEISSRLTNTDPKLDILPTKNIAEALSAGLDTCSPDDLIVITGSFYLVAEARELPLSGK
jgi:dihydrofolate synthase / folylpolyglutamate synthase